MLQHVPPLGADTDAYDKAVLWGNRRFCDEQTENKMSQDKENRNCECTESINRELRDGRQGPFVLCSASGWVMREFRKMRFLSPTVQ